MLSEEEHSDKYIDSDSMPGYDLGIQWQTQSIQ